MESELLERIKLDGRIPSHVAVIMDGNGRWARERGLPRYAGHRRGMVAVRDVVEGAVEAGIEVLTLFAFSKENWQRPRPEIAALMALLKRYADSERQELKAQGVAVHVLGELDRLRAGPRAAVERIVGETAAGKTMRLNLMISYSGRDEIVRAVRELARRARRGELDPDEIDESLFGSVLYTAGLPDPDLLIRTSGELRISNFMLWQLAYTELYISSVYWPDFTREHLFAAISDYQRRERRFGRVTAG
ncbi:MAG: isoprenyl transferase [Gemmatimonadetes bacterium]|nr:isoprenyl transferase [Gemmatimonadota bacterium]